MIHEEICTYEVAKLAKEKGFPQEVSRLCDSTSPCRNYYNHKGELNGDCLEIINCICRKVEVPIELQTIAAPTQSLLQRWLREEEGCAISVTAYPTLASFNKVCYAWEIKSSSDGVFMKSVDGEYTLSTYELALEDALKYALENLV